MPITTAKPLFILFGGAGPQGFSGLVIGINPVKRNMLKDGCGVSFEGCLKRGRDTPLSTSQTKFHNQCHNKCNAHKEPLFRGSPSGKNDAAHNYF